MLTFTDASVAQGFGVHALSTLIQKHCIVELESSCRHVVGAFELIHLTL